MHGPISGSVAQVLEGEETGAEAVGEVVVVVGDVVGDRRDLGLGAGVGVELEVVVGVVLGEREGNLAPRSDNHGSVVLGDALERLPGQVEPVELGVVRLQPRHDLDRLGVVVEAAVGRHQRLERVLAGVAEGRVAEVVGEGDGLGELLVEAEDAGDGAGDLGHLDRVGEAGAVVVALVLDEDLGLVLEPAEGRGMDDAVAVALEGRAVGGALFGEAPAAALFGTGGVASGHPGGGSEARTARARAS